MKRKVILKVEIEATEEEWVDLEAEINDHYDLPSLIRNILDREVDPVELPVTGVQLLKYEEDYTNG